MEVDKAQVMFRSARVRLFNSDQISRITLEMTNNYLSKKGRFIGDLFALLFMYPEF